MSRPAFADQIKDFAKRTGLEPVQGDPRRQVRAGLAESLEEYAARNGLIPGPVTRASWLAEGRRLLGVGAFGTGVPCFDRDGVRIVAEVEGERDDYAGPIAAGQPYGPVEWQDDYGEWCLS